MGTGTLNPEDTVNGAIAVLKANLPAKFDALDTEYSAAGDWVLDDIATADYLRAPMWKYPNSPMLVTVGASVQQREDLGGENVWEIGIAQEFILKGSKKASGYNPREMLTVKIERSMRGIIEVYLSNRGLPVSGTNKVDWVHSFDVAFSELLETRTAFEKRAELNFNALVSL